MLINRAESHVSSHFQHTELVCYRTIPFSISYATRVKDHPVSAGVAGFPVPADKPVYAGRDLLA